MLRRLAVLSAASLVSLCAAVPASAQFTTTWDNGGVFAFPASNVSPPNPPTGLISDGTSYFLTGTFTYTGTQTVYINSVDGYFLFREGGGSLLFQNGSSYSGPYSTDEFVTFLFAGGNGLAPGASFTGQISQIVVDASTVSGLYNRNEDQGFTNAGNFGFTYYADSQQTQALGQYLAPSVSVEIGRAASQAPEPGTTTLLGAAGVTMLGMVRRRKWK